MTENQSCVTTRVINDTVQYRRVLYLSHINYNAPLSITHIPSFSSGGTSHSKLGVQCFKALVHGLLWLPTPIRSPH